MNNSARGLIVLLVVLKHVDAMANLGLNLRGKPNTNLQIRDT